MARTYSAKPWNSQYLIPLQGTAIREPVQTTGPPTSGDSADRNLFAKRKEGKVLGCAYISKSTDQLCPSVFSPGGSAHHVVEGLNLCLWHTGNLDWLRSRNPGAFEAEIARIKFWHARKEAAEKAARAKEKTSEEEITDETRERTHKEYQDSLAKAA